MQAEKMLMDMVWARNHEGVMRLIEDNPGIDLDFQDGNKPTALDIASAHNDVGMVRILVEKGADVDKQGIYRETPLMSAAMERCNDAIRELLRNGASVDIESDIGTALHWVDQCLDREMAPTVGLLLDAGADHTIPDNDGFTIRDLAASFSGIYPELADEYGQDRQRVVDAIDAVERRFLLSIGRKTYKPIPPNSPKNGQIQSLRLPEEVTAAARHVLDRNAGLKYDLYYELMTLLE